MNPGLSVHLPLPGSLQVSGQSGSKGHTVLPRPCCCGDLHPFFRVLATARGWMFVSPQNSYVESLTPNTVVFGSAAFGRGVGHESGIGLNTHVKAKNSGRTRLNLRCVTNPGWERIGLPHLLCYLYLSATNPPIFM